MNVRAIGTLVAATTLSISPTASIAAEPFTIYIGGQIPSYELEFPNFRSAGVITWDSNIKIDCVSRPWPTTVHVRWTSEKGEKAEKTVELPELPQPGPTEERYLYVVFGDYGVAVRGMNQPLKAGIGKCPNKDEFPWLRNQ